LIRKSITDVQSLQDLRRLREILNLLEALVFQGNRLKRVTESDEESFRDLLSEAQVLFGRTRPMLGSIHVQQMGISRDAFQDVLGTTSMSSLFVNYAADQRHWTTSLNAARSLVNQRIGAVEKASEVEPVLDVTAALRWRSVIVALEWVRHIVVNAAKRIRGLSSPRWVKTIESSPVYRLAAIVVTVGTMITFVILVL
jgi:hypothetical protein